MPGLRTLLKRIRTSTWTLRYEYHTSHLHFEVHTTEAAPGLSLTYTHRDGRITSHYSYEQFRTPSLYEAVRRYLMKVHSKPRPGYVAVDFFLEDRHFYLTFLPHVARSFIETAIKWTKSPRKWKSNKKLIAGPLTIQSDELEDIMEVPDEDLITLVEPDSINLASLFKRKHKPRELNNIATVKTAAVPKAHTERRKRTLDDNLIPVTEIAEQVGLSDKACRAKLRKLGVERKHGTWLFDEHEATRIVRLLEKERK